MQAHVKSAALSVARIARTEEMFITLGCFTLALFLFWSYFQTYP